MNPGEITRVMMKMDLPNVPFKVPGSPRQGMQNGHEYVWHCLFRKTLTCLFSEA